MEPCSGREALSARKIIHVDMDAFFASVEQLDAPDLRGRPVAVGGARERGVVAAASYEARRFGVRSAMPMVLARRACPDLVVVPPRFDRYREISGVIRGVFLSYTPLVEPLSLDEAYLDVTRDVRGMGTARATAEAIRREIREATGLTASAGVSGNKFLAKLASDMRKPDGLFVVRPEVAWRMLEPMDVARFHGIGPATARRLAEMGVRTGADLKAAALEDLVSRFGTAGARLHAISRGLDDRPVVPDRERKSFGSETTFERDVRSVDDLRAALARVVEDVWSDRLRIGRMGRTLTLKAKHSDFRLVTRSRTDDRSLLDRQWIERTSLSLLDSLPPAPRGYRLVGLSVSNLLGEERAGRGQLDLGLVGS
jgi:DNA polymerase-4